MGIFTRVRQLFASEPEVEPSEPFTQEIGSPGTNEYHGIIVQDFNSIFHGQKGIKIYEEMRRTDGTVNAVLSALKLPVLTAEKMIESADAEDERQNEIAEFIRWNLFDKLEGGFDAFLQEAMCYLDFGFYYFEKVYEIKDGMVTLKKLAPRLPSAHYLWVMQKNLEVPGITQFLPTYKNGQNITPEIPMTKLVLFTNKKEGDNYEGTSILRSAYKHWYYKENLYRIDGVKHERGAGILTIGLPGGSTDTDKSDAQEIGRRFKLNEQAYVIKPSKEWEVDLLTKGFGDQGDALMQSVAHHNRQITANILAMFLDLGANSTGSYALSKDQTDFFQLSLKAITTYVATVLNEQLIKEMVVLNFGEQKSYPQLRFGKIGSIDYAEMSTALNTLVTAGLIKTNPELKVWVHKTFGLPEVTPEDFEDEEIDAEIGELETEIAGEPAPEAAEEAPDDETEMAELIANAETDEEVEKIMSLATPITEDTKKKISEALKRYWSTRKRPGDDDAEVIQRSANVEKATQDIKALRSQIDKFRNQSKALKSRKAKVAFNKKVRAQIEKIRAMIKAGREGSRAERERIRQKRGRIRDTQRTDRAVTRETKAREKLTARKSRLVQALNKAGQRGTSKKNEVNQARREAVDKLRKSITEIDDKLKSDNPVSLAEKYYRPLTPAEERVKFGEVEDFFDTKEEEILSILENTTVKQKETLLRQIGKAFDMQDPAIIAELSLLSGGDLMSKIKEIAKEALEEGKRTSANEINVSLPTTSNFAKKVLETKVEVLISDREKEILNRAKVRALDMLNNEVGKAQALFQLEQIIDEVAEKQGTKVAGGTVTDPFNEGRALTFLKNKDTIYALERSEILDSATCPMCMSLDGRVLSPNDPFTNIGLIHMNCRGLWVAILKGDTELPPVKVLPKSILGRFNTVDGVPATDNFQQIKKPIYTKDSRLNQKIEDGDIEI